MTIPAPPKASLSHLHRADGSATYSHNDYTVIGAINGPVEVMRRDELPEEAVIDVVVRPNVGVGGGTPRLMDTRASMTIAHSHRGQGTASRVDHSVCPSICHSRPFAPTDADSSYATSRCSSQR